jgi:glycosyltransferase involved in cell wall biosynthesis
MINEPLISIFIPVYNREKLIGETIESAINQTYKNIEIIIVDNNSTDKTWEILKSYSQKDKRIKIYRNEENIGPVRNWRRCFEYAQGEYAKFLWSDDLIAPEFIEKTLPYLINNPDVGFVFTGTEIFFNEENNEKIKAYFIGKTGLYPTEKFIESMLLGEPYSVPVSPGNALFRMKDLYKNTLIDIPNKKGIDFSKYAIGNDALIYLLTAKDYPIFAFINEVLSFFRAHMGSITISSNRKYLGSCYLLANAYFVKNYLKDGELVKKFNAILLLNTLRYGNKNDLKSIIKDIDLKIDIVYALKRIVKKLYRDLGSILKRIVKKLYRDLGNILKLSNLF